MEKWIVMAKKADFTQIGEQFSIDPVIARIIRNREVIGDEAIEQYLYGDVTMLHHPAAMKDMEKAVDILISKIEESAHQPRVGLGRARGLHDAHHRCRIGEPPDVRRDVDRRADNDQIPNVFCHDFLPGEFTEDIIAHPGGKVNAESAFFRNQNLRKEIKRKFGFFCKKA